jgi:DNA-binding NarL/FixJ family response regulator
LAFPLHLESAASSIAFPIHRHSPHIGILVQTIFEDDTSLFPAVRAGAHGYLLKNSEQDELLRAIHTVANGGAIFSPGIAQRVLGYLNAPEPNLPPTVFDGLTSANGKYWNCWPRGRTTPRSPKR